MEEELEVPMILRGSGGGAGPAGLQHVPDDMNLLVRATLNEKNAPEILQYQADLVRRVEGALAAQEEYCEQLEQDMEQELKRMMLSLEVRRVRYLLKLYYKTRLHKVEKFAATIMDQEESDSSYAARLSPAEAKYCEDYFVLVGRHLTDTVLKHMPEDFKQLVQSSKALNEGQHDLIPQPLMDTHVFCKLTDDVGAVALDEGTSVDMQSDDLYILRYRTIAHLVQSQQAVLI